MTRRPLTATSVRKALLEIELSPRKDEDGNEYQPVVYARRLDVMDVLLNPLLPQPVQEAVSKIIEEAEGGGLAGDRDEVSKQLLRLVGAQNAIGVLNAAVLAVLVLTDDDGHASPPYIPLVYDHGETPVHPNQLRIDELSFNDKSEITGAVFEGGQQLAKSGNRKSGANVAPRSGRGQGAAKRATRVAAG